MITLKSAAELLGDIPDLTLETIFTFASLTTSLKDDIILTQPATHDIDEPPLFLPPSIVTFLSGACLLSLESVRTCWGALKNGIWADCFAISDKNKDLFETHGHPYGLSMSHLQVGSFA
jgi:hypothetical protein